jgi:SSS family solute:Na+ symporter
MGVEWFGMVMGLGFVLSFGYWCTDFLVVQRAMAAKDMNAAQRTPLIGAIPKMFVPFLIIVPGMAALAILPHDAWLSNGEMNYNLALPLLLARYYPAGMLGVGLTALLASFMSGMAGNVTAFNTVWTYDLYQSHIKPNQTDKHYLMMGRWATLVGILLSVGAAYVAMGFENVMDYLQLIFSFVNAPLFATFLLGMFWKRATGHGAFFGLLSGTMAAAVHHGLALAGNNVVGIKGGWIAVVYRYPSDMAQNFWGAIIAWTSCFVLTILISMATRPRPEEQLRGLVYSLTDKPQYQHLPLLHRPATLAVMVGIMTVVLNWIYR